MSRILLGYHGRNPISPAVVLLALSTLMASTAVFAATTNNPLDPRPDLTDELIYYFDYAPADAGLIGPDKAYPFNRVTTVERIIEDRGPRGHHLVNFESAGEGSDPNAIFEVETDFTFTDISGESFALPGARGFDSTAIGGITHDIDVMNHQDISDYGGYTFETFAKWTNSGLKINNIWNPEGMHSIEILPSSILAPPKPGPLTMYVQFAARGLGNIAIPANTIFQVNDWVHVMAVMRVNEPLPEGGDPALDPLIAQYELYIDGQLLAFVDQKNTPGDPNDDEDNPVGPFDLNNSTAFASLERINRHHGIGTQEFGSPTPGNREFAGQLAMTRLTYGVLTPAQSLCGCVSAPIEDADFNDDLIVDGRDFLIWQRGRASGTTAADGDANGDNVVDGADLAIWETQYGSPPPLAAVAAVPEPTSLLLQLAGLAGLLGLRRRFR